MSEQMNAAYFEEFGDLSNVKTGKLEKPQAGEAEVLVRIKSAGVNPVDAAVARGMLKDAIPTEFPAIPGWDVAGVVEETGFSARRFKPGDEVYAYARRPVVQHGTFAEYISIPESYLALRPQEISMEASGGIPLVGLTAYQSLFDAGDLQSGQTLLILGASGGVGTLAIQLAKAKGATVIGVASESNHKYMKELGASGGVGTLAIQLAKAKGATVIGVASESNHKYMKELGADHTIDYNDDHVGAAVSDIAPDGVDLIFHCSRGDSFSQVMETGVLKEDGKVVSITKSQPDISDDIDFTYVFVEPNAVQLQHIQELTDEGKIKVPVSKTYPLDETVEALKAIETLHTQGKIVITP